MPLVKGESARKVKSFSIEIDCPPGNPRPLDLIGDVLKDTGLTTEDFDFKGTFFGNAEWVVKKPKEKLYEKKRNEIKTRLEKLYEDGFARYVSW